MSTKASVWRSEDGTLHLYYELATPDGEPALRLRVRSPAPGWETTVTIPADLLDALHECRSVELPEGYR